MTNISLVTIETVYNPLVKKEMQVIFPTNLQINKEQIINNKTNILNNKYFKEITFVIMILSTIIINLGYLQSRDSSKID